MSLFNPLGFFFEFLGRLNSREARSRKSQLKTESAHKSWEKEKNLKSEIFTIGITTISTNRPHSIESLRKQTNLRGQMAQEDDKLI